jgi:hypothetical protein
MSSYFKTVAQQTIQLFSFNSGAKCSTNSARKLRCEMNQKFEIIKLMGRWRPSYVKAVAQQMNPLFSPNSGARCSTNSARKLGCEMNRKFEIIN